jgi:hypothetical protein
METGFFGLGLMELIILGVLVLGGGFVLIYFLMGGGKDE